MSEHDGAAALFVLFGVLFGLLGLALADPLLAMIKVALERRSARRKGEIEPITAPAIS